MMKEPMFYERDGRVVRCMLCPHQCKILEGRLGKCKVRKNIDGTLYSLNYNQLSAIQIDPIEKKPIFHWMPGSRIFSIGSFGCNFHCSFCQNYSISLEMPDTISLTPTEIIDQVISLGLPSIAYTYNEPTVFYEMMMEIAKAASENGIKNVIVSNGFISKEPLLEILPYIDAMNIDLKTYSDEAYKDLGGKIVNNIIETIKIAATICHVEVTMLIVPGFNDDIGELEKLLIRLNEAAPNVVLHLSRYFPNYRYHEPETDLSLLFKLKERAEKYFDFVYLGNVR